MIRFSRIFAFSLLGLVLLAAPALAEIINGPYLTDPNRHGVTILWESSDASGQIQYGTNPSKLDQAMNLTNEKGVFCGKLTCLPPNTKYYYQVTSGGTTSNQFSFTTGVEKTQPFTFLAYGDTRTHPDDHAKVIAAMMKETGVSFVLQSGDLVEVAVLPSEWTDYFTVELPMIRYWPEVAIMGNHEAIGGRPTFEKYFNTPDHNGNNVSMHAFQFGNTYFINMDISLDYTKGSAQYNWFVAQLQLAGTIPSVKHCIVQVHFGPYSCSTHGNDADVLSLRNTYGPLFEQYGVDLVISGHDHTYQHSSVNKIDYVISGGGGAPLYPVTPQSWTVKAESTLNFVRIDVNGNVLTVTGKRPDSSVIETFQINHVFGTGSGTEPVDPCGGDDDMSPVDDDNDTSSDDDGSPSADDDASPAPSHNNNNKGGCGC